MTKRLNVWLRFCVDYNDASMLADFLGTRWIEVYSDKYAALSKYVETLFNLNWMVVEMIVLLAENCVVKLRDWFSDMRWYRLGCFSFLLDWWQFSLFRIVYTYSIVDSLWTIVLLVSNACISWCVLDKISQGLFVRTQLGCWAASYDKHFVILVSFVIN